MPRFASAGIFARDLRISAVNGGAGMAGCGAGTGVDVEPMIRPAARRDSISEFPAAGAGPALEGMEEEREGFVAGGRF